MSDLYNLHAALKDLENDTNPKNWSDKEKLIHLFDRADPKHFDAKYYLEHAGCKFLAALLEPVAEPYCRDEFMLKCAMGQVEDNAFGRVCSCLIRGY